MISFYFPHPPWNLQPICCCCLGNKPQGKGLDPAQPGSHRLLPCRLLVTPAPREKKLKIKNLFSLCPSCSAFFGRSLSRPEGADDFRICCCICFPHQVRVVAITSAGNGNPLLSQGLEEGGKTFLQESPSLREELSVKNWGVCEWLGVPLGLGVLQR